MHAREQLMDEFGGKDQVDALCSCLGQNFTQSF
jgi:hypothetical protein